MNIKERAQELYEADRANRIPGTIGNVPWVQQSLLIQKIWIHEAELEKEYGFDALDG